MLILFVWDMMLRRFYEESRAACFLGSCLDASFCLIAAHFLRSLPAEKEESSQEAAAVDAELRAALAFRIVHKGKSIETLVRSLAFIGAYSGLWHLQLCSFV